MGVDHFICEECEGILHYHMDRLDYVCVRLYSCLVESEPSAYESITLCDSCFENHIDEETLEPRNHPNVTIHDLTVENWKDMYYKHNLDEVQWVHSAKHVEEKIDDLESEIERKQETVQRLKSLAPNYRYYEPAVGIDIKGDAPSPTLKRKCPDDLVEDPRPLKK